MRLPKVSVLLTAAVLVISAAACGDDEPTPVVGGEGEGDPTIAFGSPEDGEHFAGAVDLFMTAVGVAIEPAGEVHPDAGHFHVIADEECTPAGAPIERDADHVHFGQAQADGKIYLEPGEHDLCLQIGDGEHMALDLTDTTTITVGVETPEDWCKVIGETDELFAATQADTEADFAVRKIAYENIRRLVTQLQEGIAQVDADARELVTASLSQIEAIATAYAEATDQEAADLALSDIVAANPTESGPGAPWIAENCQVDIAT